MGWTTTRARIANRKRRDPNADVTELRQQLRAERLAERIREAVDAWPPLTAAQRDQLAGLLHSPALSEERAGGDGDGRAAA